MHPSTHPHKLDPVPFPSGLTKAPWHTAEIPNDAAVKTKADAISHALRRLTTDYKILDYTPASEPPRNGSKDPFLTIIAAYNNHTLETYRQIGKLITLIDETSNVLRRSHVDFRHFDGHLSELNNLAVQFREAILLYVFAMIKTYNDQHGTNLTVKAGGPIIVSASRRSASPPTERQDPPRSHSPHASSSKEAGGSTKPPPEYPGWLQEKRWKKVTLKLRDGRQVFRTGISEALRVLERSFRFPPYVPDIDGADNHIKSFIKDNNRYVFETMTFSVNLGRLITNVLTYDLETTSRMEVDSLNFANNKFQKDIIDYLKLVVETHNSHSNGSVLILDENRATLVLRKHRT